MLDVPSKRIILARHTTPGGEIQLQQRPLANGELAFEIIVDGVFLMASYNQESERALARCALELLPKTGPGLQINSGLRLLVGGLGMGFTLQQALSFENVAAVDIVEISPRIIEWNRTYFAPLNGQALSDPRVSLIQEDLVAFLEDRNRRDRRYHSILLDVDNGPSWLAYENNAQLYTTEAMQNWSAMLFPGGSLAVWSAQREPEFLERLQATFLRVEEISVVTTSVATPKKGPLEQFIYRAINNYELSSVL